MKPLWFHYYLHQQRGNVFIAVDRFVCSAVNNITEKRMSGYWQHYLKPAPPHPHPFIAESIDFIQMLFASLSVNKNKFNTHQLLLKHRKSRNYWQLRLQTTNKAGNEPINTAKCLLK